MVGIWRIEYEFTVNIFIKSPNSHALQKLMRSGSAYKANAIAGETNNSAVIYVRTFMRYNTVSKP